MAGVSTGPPPRKGVAGLYTIIAIKLGKGLLLLLLALGVYRLTGQNLSERFDDLLRWVRLDPEKEFFAALGQKLATITSANVLQVALGTFLYSLLCLAEAWGLILRVRWAGWIVIAESLFFIPIEVFELVKRFSLIVLAILAINVLIVAYLYRNRERVFRKHHAHWHRAAEEAESP